MVSVDVKPNVSFPHSTPVPPGVVGTRKDFLTIFLGGGEGGGGQTNGSRKGLVCPTAGVKFAARGLNLTALDFPLHEL